MRLAGDPHAPDQAALVAGVLGRGADGGELHSQGCRDGGQDFCRAQASSPARLPLLSRQNMQPEVCGLSTVLLQVQAQLCCGHLQGHDSR